MSPRGFLGFVVSALGGARIHRAASSRDADLARREGPPPSLLPIHPGDASRLTFPRSPGLLVQGHRTSKDDDQKENASLHITAHGEDVSESCLYLGRQFPPGSPDPWINPGCLQTLKTSDTALTLPSGGVWPLLLPKAVGVPSQDHYSLGVLGSISSQGITSKILPLLPDVLSPP
ncbi:hypothetical protein H8959_015952 [Pygathrix nigripes]